MFESIRSYVQMGRANHYEFEGFGYKRCLMEAMVIPTKALTAVSQVMWYENNNGEI